MMYSEILQDLIWKFLFTMYNGREDKMAAWMVNYHTGLDGAPIMLMEQGKEALVKNYLADYIYG